MKQHISDSTRKCKSELVLFQSGNFVKQHPRGYNYHISDYIRIEYITLFIHGKTSGLNYNNLIISYFHYKYNVLIRN